MTDNAAARIAGLLSPHGKLSCVCGSDEFNVGIDRVEGGRWVISVLRCPHCGDYGEPVEGGDVTSAITADNRLSELKNEGSA